MCWVHDLPQVEPDISSSWLPQPAWLLKLPFWLCFLCVLVEKKTRVWPTLKNSNTEISWFLQFIEQKEAPRRFWRFLPERSWQLRWSTASVCPKERLLVQLSFWLLVALSLGGRPSSGKGYIWIICGVMASRVTLSKPTVGLQRKGGSGFVGLPGLM